jgi:hypothetical protein
VSAFLAPEVLDVLEVAEDHADGLIARTRLMEVRERVRWTQSPSNVSEYTDTAEAIALAAADYSTRPRKDAVEKAAWAAHQASWLAGLIERPAFGVWHNLAQADILRDIFGNAFSPMNFDPSWRTDTAIGLAGAIYTERAFDRMPILADALEDAGCDNADVLTHCRGTSPHVRGCWVVDLVLGKS